MQGYTPYTNKLVNKANFEESTWVESKLRDADTLLIGVFYRSPNSSRENHDKLRDLIHEAVSRKSSHLLLMGDFNYNDIDWRLETSPPRLDHPAMAFKECLRDCYLFQRVKDPTYYRETQTPNTLDLIISNEEGMVDGIELAAPIGKSHHVVISYRFYCYTEEAKAQQPRLIYHKGDYEGMR